MDIISHGRTWGRSQRRVMLNRTWHRFFTVLGVALVVVCAGSCAWALSTFFV